MNKNLELSLYRIIQELIQNVLKHAAATEILVQLSSRTRILSMTVEDNGKGWTGITGIGLQNIRHRVNELKGHIDIRHNEQAGMAIYLEFNTAIFNYDTTSNNR
jgi:signal transduction histidine kinase